MKGWEESPRPKGHADVERLRQLGNVRLSEGPHDEAQHGSDVGGEGKPSSEKTTVWPAVEAGWLEVWRQKPQAGAVAKRRGQDRSAMHQAEEDLLGPGLGVDGAEGWGERKQVEACVCLGPPGA